MKKQIRFSDLEDPEVREVWVLNKAQLIYGRPTTVAQSVTSPDGTVVSLVIPATWIPIEVTAQASKSALLSSEHFRRAVAQGQLVLLSPEDAMEILEDEDAKKEQQRLIRESIAGLRGEQPSMKDQEETKMQNLAANANSLLVSVFENSDSDSMSQRSNVLRRLNGVLNDADIAYIKSKTSDPKLLALL